MQQEFDSRLFSKVYVKAPRKPDNFDLRVMEITGGRARVVWGMDVFTFRNGDPKAVKYPWTKFGVDRFILEAWRAPFCTEDEWEKARYRKLGGLELPEPTNEAEYAYIREMRMLAGGEGTMVDMSGPYPAGGIWGMIMPILDMRPDHFGGYLPCSEDLLRWIQLNHQAWENGPQGKAASLQAYNQMMDQMMKEQEEIEAEAERGADEHSAWVRAHEDQLNAGTTRESILLTPSGQPWRIKSNA